jgi:Protein of unknown function (DUF229)
MLRIELLISMNFHSFPFQAGFFEERAPIFRIRLPTRFIKQYPQLVRNLKANSNRLITPYDLHITLLHILNLSVKKSVLLKAAGCSQCQSLFDEVSECRRCRDVAIPKDSCPCSITKLSVSKKVVKYAVSFAVNALNEMLQTMTSANGEKCSQVSLVNITSAHEQLGSREINYIVRFTVTKTNAEFEAFMRRKTSTLFSMKPKFEMIQEIVNMNEKISMCVPESSGSPSGSVERRFNYEYYDDEDW